MSNPICCPKCQGTNIRSIDNQPLYHPKKEEVTQGIPSFDNEIYIEFNCLNCNPKDTYTNSFTIVFDLVPQAKQPNI